MGCVRLGSVPGCSPRHAVCTCLNNKYYYFLNWRLCILIREGAYCPQIVQNAVYISVFYKACWRLCITVRECTKFKTFCRSCCNGTLRRVEKNLLSTTRMSLKALLQNSLNLKHCKIQSNTLLLNKQAMRSSLL